MLPSKWKTTSLPQVFVDSCPDVAVSSVGASGDARGMRREESACLESRQSGRSLKISDIFICIFPPVKEDDFNDSPEMITVHKLIFKPD